jgi:hypothetical protein
MEYWTEDGSDHPGTNHAGPSLSGSQRPLDGGTKPLLG